MRGTYECVLTYRGLNVYHTNRNGTGVLNIKVS